MRPHDINEKGIIIPGGMKDEFLSLVVRVKGIGCVQDIGPGDIVIVRCSSGVFVGDKRNVGSHFVSISENEVLGVIKEADVEQIEAPVMDEEVEKEKALEEELMKIKPIIKA